MGLPKSLPPTAFCVGGFGGKSPRLRRSSETLKLPCDLGQGTHTPLVCPEGEGGVDLGLKN